MQQVSGKQHKSLLGLQESNMFLPISATIGSSNSKLRLAPLSCGSRVYKPDAESADANWM